MTLCALVLVLGAPSTGADDGMDHTWSWVEQGDAGDVGLRLAIDFGEDNHCRFELTTSRVAQWGDEASFYGRDDESIAFHVAEYSETGWGEAWNHGGEADSRGWKAGDQAFLVQSLEGANEGVETWIFAGYNTSIVDADAFPSFVLVPQESFGLTIACSQSFDIRSIESAVALQTFEPEDTCALARQVGAGICGIAFGVEAEGTLRLEGERNIVRYHQFSFMQDAGMVRVEGPDTHGEMVYASNGFLQAPPGLRVEGKAGDYTYTFSHLGGAPYTVGGYAFAFNPEEM